jgi:hypothetical protein
MANVTSAAPAAKYPARPGQHRVLFHEAVCPESDCGSDDIAEDEIETGDGITEIVLTCRDCGTAWPLACVVDWDNRP